MGGDQERERADAEARGLLPRAWVAGPPSWRRVVDWILRDREDIDQQGLLAKRTLFPRPPHDPGRSGPEPAAPPPDDHGT